jgi:hypothetical protein
MMKQMFILCTVLALTAPVAAHHGNASTEAKTVVMKATVTQWLWSNPHTFLKFDVKDDNGSVTHWTAEWNNPSTLVNFGLTARTFKAGDQVTVTLDGVAKSGAPIGRIKEVMLADGTVMRYDGAAGGGN